MKRDPAAASFISAAAVVQVISAILLLVIVACATQPDASRTPDAQIRAVLDAQQLAWNRGDIEDFMQGYWHDDALRFESGTSTTFGWQATYDRYVAHYPDRAAMGRLQFSDIQISALDPDHARATGGWELQHASDHPHGSFALDFQRFGKNWKIVKDHTEKAP